MWTNLFRFWISVTGRPAAWIVSVVFILVGAVITIFLPPMVEPSRDRETIIVLLRLLGGVFFCLGVAVFLWMLADWYLGRVDSPLRERWFWWGNFLAGMISAGLFSIPATLMFPAMLAAYLLRPNALFPNDQTDVANNLWVGAIFSVFGTLGLGMMYLVGRDYYRNRPRPLHHARATKRERSP